MRVVASTVLVVFTAAAAVWGQGASEQMNELARKQLLPAGHLRVGINTGNQLTRVVGREIASELARRLNSDAVFLDYGSPGAVADASAAWDIAFIAADPDREAAIAFTPPYVELEAAYLVTAASPIRS